MKTRAILLLCTLTTVAAHAQFPDVIRYDDGKPTQFNALNAGDHTIVLFQPLAPDIIDSITFAISAPQGGQIELHLWQNEGGEAFAENYWDWCPPLTATLTASASVQYVTLRLATPINNNAVKPFYAGTVTIDPSVHLMADASIAPATCSSASGGEYFHSFLQTNGQYYLGNGDFVVHAYVRYFYEGNFLTDVSSGAGFPQGFAGSKRMCWGDYNNDGYEDVLVGATKLFKNNGNGTFTDVTVAAGIDQAGTIAAMADMNNDGWLDIVLEPGSVIYENKHDGTFTKHANAAPKQSLAPTCIAVADFDNDGKLDYFVGNWEHEYNLKKTDYPSSTDANATELVLGVGYPAYLFHNNGNFTFTDTTSLLRGYGIENLGFNAYTNQYDQPGNRVVYGAQWCDYNNDGHLDLFVCNYRLQGNFLWQNDGQGVFHDAGVNTGLIGHEKTQYPKTYGHTIGCDWGDYNNDGNMDIILSQLAHPRFVAFSDRTALYKNSGPPDYTFNDQRYPPERDTTGINYEETHTDVAWGDYDNDGLLDFGITAVYGCRYASLYHQKIGGGSFEETTYYGSFKIADGWGVTWVDYDNDGWLDLAMSGDDGFHLLHNDIKNLYHHLAIHLRSYSGNRFGVGSRVTAYAGGQRYTREIVAGKGSGSSNPPVAYFGLRNSNQVDSLIVRWSDGHIDRFSNVSADSVWLATEGNSALHNYRDSLTMAAPHIMSSAPRTNVGATEYPGDTTVYTGLAYLYNARATGSAPLNFSMVSGPAGIVMKNSGTLKWTPASTDAGDVDIAIRVTNGAGIDTQHVRLHVVAGARPAAAPHIDRKAVRSQEYRDTAFATGNPAPRFSFSARPGGATIDSITGIIIMNPTLPITYTAGVVASNPYGNDTVQWRIAVSRSDVAFGENLAPSLPILEQNFPNPFIVGGGASTPTTDITFFIPYAASGELAIYSMVGQRISTYARGVLTEGSHVIRWNGSDERGRRVPPGEYVYVLRVGTQVARKMLTVVR